MIFDWNSSAKFEGGHRRSNVTLPNGVPPPQINSNTSNFDEIDIICISHKIRQIPRISDSFNYCKPP